MNIFDFYKKKISGDKISFMTCYDYTSARILASTSIDCLLVGDTLAMTMHGFKDTLAATVEMMCLHTAAVSRGAGDKFILGAAFSQWFINFGENKAPLGLYSIAVPTWYLAIQADQNRLGFATMVTF